VTDAATPERSPDDEHDDDRNALDDLDADQVVEDTVELFQAPADSPASDTAAPPPG
jgi:hypothetical protein